MEHQGRVRARGNHDGNQRTKMHDKGENNAHDSSEKSLIARERTGLTSAQSWAEEGAGDGER